MAEQQVPKIVLELMEKAEEAFRRRNFDYAIELFGQAAEVSPNFVEARKRLREVEFLEFEHRTTPVFLHKIISAFVNAVPMLSATIQTSSKKYNKAMNTCEKMLLKNPHSTLALVALSQAAEKGNYIEIAIQSMEFARKLKPRSMNIIKRLGYLYKDNDQVDEAKVCFQSIVARNPGNKEADKALYDLAALGAIIKGGWEDTTSYRDKIKDVDFSQTAEKESRSVRSVEDQKSLEETYTEQLEIQPDNIDNYRKLAELYIEKKEFDKALGIYDRAIEKFPQNPDLSEMRFQTVSFKYADQTRQLEEKLSHNPDDAAVAQELEKLQREKLEYMMEHVHQRVEKYPNDLALRFEYGGLLLETGSLDEAIKQFQLSVKSAQSKATSLSCLGKCFFQKGLLDFAIDQYKKALEETKSMDDFKKEILYHLGLIYEQQNQNDLALEQYQIIYQEDIGYEDVSQRVEKLYAEKKKTQ